MTVVSLINSVDVSERERERERGMGVGMGEGQRDRERMCVRERQNLNEECKRGWVSVCMSLCMHTDT